MMGCVGSAAASTARRDMDLPSDADSRSWLDDAMESPRVEILRDSMEGGASSSPRLRRRTDDAYDNRGVDGGTPSLPTEATPSTSGNADDERDACGSCRALCSHAVRWDSRNDVEKSGLPPADWLGDPLCND